MKKTALFLFLAFLASAEELNVSYFNLETMTQKYRPDTIKDFSGAIHTKQGNYQVFKKTLGNLDFSKAEKKEIFFGKLSDYYDLQHKLATSTPFNGADGELQKMQNKVSASASAFGENLVRLDGGGLGALISVTIGSVKYGVDVLRADNEYIMVEEATQGNKKGKISTLFICDSGDYQEAEIRKIMEKKQ